jgi:hypothetical protein
MEPPVKEAVPVAPKPIEQPTKVESPPKIKIVEKTISNVETPKFSRSRVAWPGGPTTNNNIGTDLPAIYPDWWMISSDDYAILSMLSENTKFRTNVAWVWEGNITFSVKALSSTGREIGTLRFNTYELESCNSSNESYKNGKCSGTFQANNFLSFFTKGNEENFALKFTPISGDGKVFFYATVIDNLSNDATLFPQFRYTSTGKVWSASGPY